MSGRRAFVRRLWVLMATVFVDMVGFLMVLPLLPFYAERMGATESTVGALISTFAFAQLATSPLWGRASDRYGRRPMIILGLTASALAFILFGLAGTVAVLFLSRLVQGAGGGTAGVVQAYVSDSVPPAERAKALGWMSAASSAGVTLGPVVGSLAFRLGGPAAPGFVAAGLCLLNVLFAWRWLPESAEAPAAGEAAGPPAARRRIRGALFQVLRHPGTPIATLIYVYAFGMMAFMAMNGVIALYLDHAFGITEETVGWFYMLMGAVSFIMRATLLGPVVDRLGEVRTLRLGVLSLVVGLALMPLPGHVWGLAAVAILVPVGTAFLFPATTSLVSQHSPPGEIGQSLGVQQAFGGVSRMLGPIWATGAFQYLSWAAPFWLASGLMSGVGLISLRVRRPRPAEAAGGGVGFEVEASSAERI